MSPLPQDYPANPYVGPRSFAASERDRFFGRDQEIGELSDLLVAGRIVLMHSASGAGKTSLIRAGLLPRLESDFDILPLARVAQSTSAVGTGNGSETINRYVLGTLLSWQNGDAKAHVTPQNSTAPPPLPPLTLEQYLNARPRTNKPRLLVFDQFEEILTVNELDKPAKDEFFRQLAVILRRARSMPAQEICWALFAFREEYLAVLQPYFLRHFGTALETFRLDLLGPEAAVAAVRAPAEKAGIPYDDDAARQLVDNLRRVGSSETDTAVAGGETLGNYVEPVQLQVVCFRLWEKLKDKNKRRIKRQDIVDLADVDNALGGYFAEKMEAIAAARQFRELELRDWIDQHLITAERRRAMVQLDQGEVPGLPAQVVLDLLNAFLVRREERRGLSWLELAHDRLVDPIRRDNDRWFAEHLQPFQLQANRWDRLKQSNEFLLRGLELASAKEWADKNDESLRDIDRDYLDKSRASTTWADAIKLRYYRWWLYVSLAALAIVGVISIGAIWWANQKQNEANRIAENAANSVQRANADLNAIEKETIRLLSAVLRLPMESAAAIATADTKEKAQTALDNWRKMFEAIANGNNRNPQPTTSKLLEIQQILNQVPDDDLPADVQVTLRRLTLELAKQDFPALLKTISVDDASLSLGLKEHLFRDAEEITQKLAQAAQANDPQKTWGATEDQKQLENRFWQLYYGQLPFCEGDKVESAMVEFGKSLKKGDLKALSTQAQNVQKATQAELKPGGKFDKKRILAVEPRIQQHQ